MFSLSGIRGMYKHRGIFMVLKDLVCTRTEDVVAQSVEPALLRNRIAELICFAPLLSAEPWPRWSWSAVHSGTRPKYTSCVPHINEQTKLLKKRTEEEVAPWILPCYFWVKSHVRSDHTFDDESQSLLSKSNQKWDKNLYEINAWGNDINRNGLPSGSSKSIGFSTYTQVQQTRPQMRQPRTKRIWLTMSGKVNISCGKKTTEVIVAARKSAEQPDVGEIKVRWKQAKDFHSITM